MALTESTARANLRQLVDKYNALSLEDIRTMNEASIVRQFVDILLRDVLAWPIEDTHRYKYELHTTAGRPDITLIPESGGTIFVEAKKFGVIRELEQSKRTISGLVTPGQLALPGMSVDRSNEEQQAINYAFENGGTWAILTNFEKLRLFNARRDWLVLSFEKPIALIDEFDLLWQLSYPNILDGTLEQLSSLRHREEVDTTYLAFINEWRERLAKDIIAHPHSNPWAFTAETINLPLLREVVQQFLDRLVVIRFAEDHLVLKADTLRGLYELRKDNIYTFSMDEFVDRFFRRFDEEHNSSLFAFGPVDEAVFSDEVLIPLIAKLYEARYRAMPADILGNTYEQYLGKALAIDRDTITTRDNLETRKKQGSYYTPQVIVRHIVDNSLGRYLYGTANGRPDGEPVTGETRQTSRAIRDLRVLDSACGSGSFLIYAYYVLAEFYTSEIERLNRDALHRAEELARQGLTQIDIGIETAATRMEVERITDYPRLILEHHLYGIDLDPQAAEIAVVNLIMRAMERKGGKHRLPLILNQNVKVGNSLIGLRPDDPRLTDHAPTLAALRALRLELIGTPNTDPRHDVIVVELRTLSQQINETLNVDFAQHFSDLKRTRPFNWGVEFPEVFFDADGTPLEKPGFQVIIGNPPWEIVKPDLREFYAQFDPDIESRLNRSQAEARIAELNTHDPQLTERWQQQIKGIEQSAAYFQRSSDYTRQGRGDTATHKLFLERMYGLLGDGGRLGYVVPSGIYTDLGTKDLREMLFSTGQVEYMFGLANVRLFFAEVDSRFKFTLVGVKKGGETDKFRTMFLLSHADWPHIERDRSGSVTKDSSAILQEVIGDEQRIFTMSVDMIRRFSPTSLSIMEFQTQQDYEIAEKVYADWPVLGDEVADCWNVKFTAEFHVTNDRRLFNTQGRGLPLYEGKMIHQFDAYFAEPQYWLEEEPASERLAQKYNVSSSDLDYLKPRLAYRGIARSTDNRTLMMCMLPSKTFSEGRSATTVIQKNITHAEQLYLAGCGNSLVIDWLLRSKVAANVNMFHIYSLPVPRLTGGDPYFDAIVPRAARLTCTREPFADLWQTVMGEAWDDSKGATDPAQRQRLRDEIDAIVAHLYGLSRADFAHILGTFPLVFPDNAAGHARREALLQTFDAFAGRL